VTFCLAAGEAARLQLRFGGKAGPNGGAPIDAWVEVVRAAPESWQSFGASRVTLGPSALVRLAGTDIQVILNTNRTQTFEPNVFSNLGVDPASKAILLVKSTNHFYAGFAPIAEGIVYIDAGAPYPSHPKETQYKKLSRDIWP
jgi:microcystin degradation protein MlrC